MGRYKILGYIKPAESTLVSMYQVPVGFYTRVYLMKVTVSDGHGQGQNIRIHTVLSGDTPSDSNLFHRQKGKQINEIIEFRDICLDEGESVRVEASVGDYTFILFGEEFDKTQEDELINKQIAFYDKFEELADHLINGDLVVTTIAGP